MTFRVLRYALLSLVVLGFSALGFAPLPAPVAAQFATNTPALAATATQAAPPAQASATLPAPSPTSAPAVLQVFEPPECAYVAGQTTSEACRAIIDQFPEPNVLPIEVDGYTLATYAFWRIGPNPTNQYDAAGGNVVGQMPQGFNFVNAVTTQDGWIQAEDGVWYSTADAKYVEASSFVGVELPQGWNHPFAWVLDTTGIYASLTPGGESTSESGLIPLHHQRFNIFAEAVAEDGWTWYMVGPNQWVKQIFLAVVRPTPRPEGVSGRWVAVDLFEQTLVAYEEDRPVFATLISTGLPNTETNEGLFQVWARLPRDGMSGATGAPNAYALQSVPWVQYFDGSISLHGTYWHNFYGYRRSRGCVNLSISDARWVYQWMTAAPEGEATENYVYVHSTGEYRKP